MALGNINTLEVGFSAPVEDLFIDGVEMILNVLKAHEGCLAYGISTLQRRRNSILITGYWESEESMLLHCSSSGFTGLVDCLISRCVSLHFKTFFMRDEDAG